MKLTLQFISQLLTSNDFLKFWLWLLNNFDMFIKILYCRKCLVSQQS